MLVVNRTHKYKLFRTKRTKYIERQMRIACSVYNHSIAVHKCYYKLYKKHLSAFSLLNHLTKLKQNNPKYKYWDLLQRSTFEEITERIDLAYKKFFKKENARPPKFRKSSKYNCLVFKSRGVNGVRKIQGITFDKYTMIINGSSYAKKLDKNCKKSFKFGLHRPFDGELRRLTIVKNSLNEFFICVALQKKAQERVETGSIAGVDFGLKNFLTLDNGLQVQSPEFHKQYLKPLKKASRKFSLKKRGSNNSKRARLELARLQKRITNLRNDFLHKLSHTLAGKYDTISLENLNMSGMIKLWGRKVLDLSFAKFVDLLSYKTRVIKIGKFVPTSKICSNCGHGQKMQLKDRIFDCEKCDLVMDRDLNAAKNIKIEGQASIAGGKVILTPVSVCC